MDFLLGLITALVFFIALLGTLYVGYKIGKKSPAPKQVDEDEKNKTDKFNKHFKALFAYDVDTALKPKRVK